MNHHTGDSGGHFGALSATQLDELKAHIERKTHALPVGNTVGRPKFTSVFGSLDAPAPAARNPRPRPGVVPSPTSSNGAGNAMEAVEEEPSTIRRYSTSVSRTAQ